MTAPNNAFVIFNNNAGRIRWTTIPGAYIDGAQYGLRIYSGATVHGAATTIENSEGIIATIGRLRGGSYGANVSSINAIGFNRLSGMTSGTSLITGWEPTSGNSADAGSLRINGGPSQNSNWSAGNLLLEGGNLGSAWSLTGGSPGSVFIRTYPDHDVEATHLSDNVPRNIHIYRGSTYNWEWYQRKQTTSGIQTLTMESDTVKYRIENLGTISTSTDADGDIVIAHGMGVTPTNVSVQVTGLASGAVPYFTVVLYDETDATNFTVRFFDSSGTAVTSTAVTATWHAKT
jgi:hypothetical protein